MADRSRLFLVTPPVADAAAFAPLLEAAVGAADIACVLLQLAAPDAGAAKAIIRALAPIAQARGAAILVEDDARLAVRAEADGVHLVAGDGPALQEALDQALAALRPERIVGVGGLVDRDAAMHAGEAGVDYVMFDGEGAAEMARWWAEIFNVPCVAMAAAGLDEVGEMAATGAEFVGLGAWLWDEPGAIAATLRAAEAMLAPAAEAVR